MKSAAPMRAREIVGHFFGSADAFANLEHALFGFFCILTGYGCLQALLFGASPAPGPTNRPEWARRLGRLVMKIPGIGVVGRFFRWSLRLAWVAIRDLNSLRILGLTGTALILGWTSPEWRYNNWGLISATAWLICLAWLLWNPRSVAHLARHKPIGFMLLVAVLVMLQWEVVWKFGTIASGQNSIGHALRHLAYCGGGVIVGALLLSPLLFCRKWVLDVVFAIAVAGLLALLFGFYSSPLRAPAVGTKGFAVSGASDLRPNGVAMHRGQLRLYYRQPVDAEVYALGEDGQTARLEPSRKDYFEVTELALPIPCGTVIIKQGDRQAVVQPAEGCPKQVKN